MLVCASQRVLPLPVSKVCQDVQPTFYSNPNRVRAVLPRRDRAMIDIHYGSPIRPVGPFSIAPRKAPGTRTVVLGSPLDGVRLPSGGGGVWFWARSVLFVCCCCA
jgi:hypothetical protein